MELEEAIRGRRSIRKFRSDPVPRNVIEELLDLAMWAPSGMNQQNWYFVVVRGEALQRLAEISRRAFDEHTERSLLQVFMDKPEIMRATRRFFCTFGNAPMALLVYRIATVEGELTDIQSVAAAIQNFLLAAYARGIGACWMTGPTHFESEINELVGVEDMRLQALVPMGYPDAYPFIPKRKKGKVNWIGFEE